eukprot:gene138-750_t
MAMQMLNLGEAGCGTPGLRRSFTSGLMQQTPGTDSLKRRAKPLITSKNNIASLSNVTATDVARNSQVRVTINVRGTIYETLATTLARYPDTMLGDETRRAVYYDVRGDCLRFDRNRASFEAVLFYYQSHGCLICPFEVSMQEFENDCAFYGLDEDDVWIMKEREGFTRPPVVKQKRVAKTVREKLNEFLEDQNSSKPAGAFAIFSMLMVIGSVTLTCLTTLPEIHETLDPSDVSGNAISLSDMVMNVFFLLEILLKFACTPERLKFVKSPMNQIDAFAVFPYFIAFAIDVRQISSLAFIKVFRTVRVLRLLRFSKHSDTLRVVINILSSSVRDLFTVVFCMLLMSIMWGSLAYYVESGVGHTQFTSIPEAMWWAIQTIVCLGYGDVIPVTAAGKIAASAAAVVGALTLTVPLLSIGGRYLTMYSKTFDVKSMQMDGNNNNGSGGGSKTAGSGSR